MIIRVRIPRQTIMSYLWRITVGCLSLAFGYGSATLASPQKTIIGIQPLQALQGQAPHSLVPPHIRPLLTSQEIEEYLSQLEGSRPPWDQLSSHDMTEQSDRLFQFNRDRDQTREHKLQLLQQPIAFIWEGELRVYDEEYQGFRVALGPAIIKTLWGLVRFKPRDIPDFMIATISSEKKGTIPGANDSSRPKDIGILFMGTMVESESIMYAFSHDGNHEGMILPFVNITAVQYYLK